MQIVIPMSGSGTRFVRAGYTTLKPLIEIDGRPMIEHVVRMFPGETDFVFICAEPHLVETPMREILTRIAPRGRIVPIAAHKRGPVHAVLEAAHAIDDDAPVVVNYCDFGAAWDYAAFKRRMEELGCAGAITAYRGFHPHSLGPTLYAYLRERDGWMLEIQEKRPFTDARMREFASAGTYYFRSGALVKRYFRRAVERGLETNGEFYASMPFNLMIEDGLDVAVWELAHFLQWGTPEDLEEYQAWSRYFRSAAAWTPSLAPQPGAVVVPMAGAGARFSAEGYAAPKPLVPVAGVPMVQRALRTLPAARRAIALCRREHLAAHDVPQRALETVVRGVWPNVEIVAVPALTEGQASTCLLARPHVDPDAPLLIAPCDATTVYDADRYAALTRDPSVDAIVWTFRNHPHANRHPRQYGWVAATSTGAVTRISCKTPLGDDVRHDPGIVGAFWFRRARTFFDAADALIARDERINGEFYVDAVVGSLVAAGCRARIFDVDHYVSFGTPDDVRTYEYWARYFAGVAADGA